MEKNSAVWNVIYRMFNKIFSQAGADIVADNICDDVEFELTGTGLENPDENDVEVAVEQVIISATKNL